MARLPILGKISDWGIRNRSVDRARELLEEQGAELSIDEMARLSGLGQTRVTICAGLGMSPSSCRKTFSGS